MNSHINAQFLTDGAPRLVVEWFAHERLGSVLTSGALSVVSVYRDPTEHRTDYRTITGAIALGEALVTELSQATVYGLRVVTAARCRY